MPSVFLSYSRDDLSLIEHLERLLKSSPEISIWRDQEKLYGGQKWPKILGEAIADAASRWRPALLATCSEVLASVAANPNTWLALWLALAPFQKSPLPMACQHTDHHWLLCRC